MKLNFKIILPIFGILIGVGVGIMFMHSVGYPDTSNPKSELSNIEKNKKDAVIVFHKTGCSDCKTIQSLVKQTIKENKTRVQYIVIDLKDEDNRSLIKKYNLVSTPTIIQYKHGQEYRRYAGTDRGLVQNILEGVGNE